MSFLLAILLVQLSAAEVRALEKYGVAWSELKPSAELIEQARAEFGNRGVAVAEYFVRHIDPRPRNDAYFFVLRAVGDAETVLVLIRALPNPPPRTSGILDRDFGEVEVAIQAVLDANDSVPADPRIVPALLEVFATARTKPYGTGMQLAFAAIDILGHCHTADAVHSLERLAADADPKIRAAAATALGNQKQAQGTQPRQPGDFVMALLRILERDPSPEARRQAAESLVRVDGPEPDIVAGLHSALNRERNSQVVDAILQGLYRHGAPIQDPLRCRELIARTWDAYFAQQMFNCWRVAANREELLQAALSGPPTVRAAALDSLVPAEPSAPLVQSLIENSRPGPPRLDPMSQERLLNAAVDVLSQRGQISDSTRDMTHQALWRISGRNMAIALGYADRITPAASRFQASAALAHADTGAYNAYRRNQQFRAGALLALGIAVFLFWAPLRRGMATLSASALAWGIWSLQLTGVRELSPPPLRWLSASAIGFLSAGAVTAIVTFVPRKERAAGRGRSVMRLIVAVAVSGTTAFVVCGWTRNARLFPVGSEGWELLFDPLGSFLLAIAVAGILATTNFLIGRSRTPA